MDAGVLVTPIVQSDNPYSPGGRRGSIAAAAGIDAQNPN